MLRLYFQIFYDAYQKLVDVGMQKWNNGPTQGCIFGEEHQIILHAKIRTDGVARVSQPTRD